MNNILNLNGTLVDPLFDYFKNNGFTHANSTPGEDIKNKIKSDLSKNPLYHVVFDLMTKTYTTYPGGIPQEEFITFIQNMNK
jgi:hypothetical protein